MATTAFRTHPILHAAWPMTMLGCLTLVGAVAPASLGAQESTPVPSDSAYALVIEPERTLEFTTDEGTWLSVDVSPDGTRVVFDLLGDLYLLPVSGGQAQRLTSGMAWDGMPRWSPDGLSIAFISDRDGTDNLWRIGPDGSGLRKLTSETTSTLSSPVWSPDGQYLVVRRFGPYPSAENYLTNVPLWMVHVDGGRGTQVYPADAGAKTTNTGAAFSPDGRTLYTSTHAGGYAGENLGRYQVVAYDLDDGTERTLTGGAGGGLRPIASPNGRWLVYATRAGTETSLRLRDLQTHEDTWLAASMQRDDQEGYAPNDVLPGYAFTPDSRAVVYSGGGKLWRVDLESREVAPIPFQVDVELEMGPRHRVPLRVEDGPLAVSQLMSVVESPAGDAIAFSAVGSLWSANRTGGGFDTPRRITDTDTREYFPAYSPDGRWLAYVTWSDTDGGHVWKVRADGQGAPVRLTEEPGFVEAPMWSPDGSRVVYAWQPRQAGLGHTPVASVGELRSVSSEGGAASMIVATSSRPSGVAASDDAVTGTADDRVYFARNVPNATPGFNATRTTALHSVRLDGTQERTHLKVVTGNAGSPVLRVSPDERHVLVLERDDVYALPIAPVGASGLTVDFNAPSVPLRRLTREGANYAAWADGGASLLWSFTNHVSKAPTESVMRSAASEQWGISTADVSLTVPRSVPEGDVVLRGARIITMRGDEVLERGDIWIQGNRIRAVGSSVDAPADAEEIDASGTTIMPGIVDTHAHPRTGREMAPDQEWSIASNLAFGVTTTRNPSGSRWNVAWGELIEAGKMVGSRIYATGFPVTSNNAAISDYDDALAVVRRYERQGVHSIKQYLQPRRLQRQWVLQAGIAENINVTNEGAADLRMDLSMAVDGFTAIEHSIGQVPLYEDVVRLYADARIAYTPTLTVAYGAPAGDSYFRARTDLDQDPKTAFFTPAEVLIPTRRRRMVVEEDYNFPLIARGVRDIVRAGGLAGLGSHGQQDGIAAHWELWMLHSGDMTNHEALRIATLLGAESIGFEQDLGSLEPGKLADLIVLESNPLDDIRNSTDIRWVMKNGELYEGDSLDRIWPSPRPFPTPHWVQERERLEALQRR